MTVVLEPLRRQGEVLRSDTVKRPAVRVPTDGRIITLGKNATTQIADSGLKRKCVSLQVRNQKQLKVLGAIPVQVSVNGALVQGDGHSLVAGDILALHAPEIAYEFQVVVQGGSLVTMEANPASMLISLVGDDKSNETFRNTDTSVCLTSAAPSQQEINQYNDAIADDLACAVCLEIVVHATTLVPCGHTFCRSCLQNTTNCPTCRGSVQSTVHCRTIDNVIASLVAQQHPHPAVFEPDDVEKYRERAGSQIASTTITRTSRRKR